MLIVLMVELPFSTREFWRENFPRAILEPSKKVRSKSVHNHAFPELNFIVVLAC